ncbi:MAG: hypothetical protein HRU09_19210 [Oligoflexales bacterium]|nr:hypothetical protein [Oligoflexales bacterium]
MSFMALANTYAPFLSLIVIGYCLAHWVNLSSNNLTPLIRYVFLPVIIYSSVSGRIAVKTLALLILSGASVTAMSKFIFEKVNAKTNVRVSVSASFPNVAYFTFPLLAMVYGSKGFATASSFLLGSILAFEGMNGSSIDWKKFVKEPIIFAAILGIVVAFTGYKVPVLGKVISPIYKASFSVILIYLGTLLHPLNNLNFGEAFASVVLRVASGFAAALLLIKLFAFNGLIAKTIMLCALSPPGTPMGSSSRGDDAEKLGVIVCFIFVILMNHFRWTPWSIRF